ncbi:hypothetical protein OUZ56_025539 [Daphnia magna]|uniref:Uncharacterized protein n=1 Tax=Daphnia magna TaxID=35525 RepID=A0ABQ9ZK55_9CRUS|nr:hypothetical protein OUZ56_025539 [Daphnia magna]
MKSLMLVWESEAQAVAVLNYFWKYHCMTATFNMEKNKAQQENKQRQPPDLDSAATADEWAGCSAAQKPSPMPSVQTNDLTWDQPP